MDTQESKKILIVDDEPAIRDSLRLLLKNHFDVETAENGEQAVKILDKSTHDLVLLDVMMPEMDGLSTLKEIREKGHIVPIIMLTADNTAQSAVQALKMGALDYLSKPFDITALTELLVNTLRPAKNFSNNRQHTSEIVIEADFGPMVGASSKMEELFNKVKSVSERNSTVLITGESGTGKELVARQIHDLSLRKDKPFIAINCAAIPETLIESELFGHEKGAFTSAVDKRIGYFELANGGTLFLDEIGELSLAVQVKMLRFLQEQEFYRIGQSKPTKVDVRVITATNKKLEDLIVENKFRQDLYYRINVVQLEIPALRDRGDDIEKLIGHFITKFSPSYGGKQINFSDEALLALKNYTWPGNVRELENVVEALMALTTENTVSLNDLPGKFIAKKVEEQFDPKMFEGSLNFQEAEKTFETEMILKALKQCGFVQTKTAELLGISRRILKYKMDKLGITDRLDELTK